ncbi:MAG: site-2 protease family protein, partial [Candidatus Andersenbacteria bacterium]
LAASLLALAIGVILHEVSHGWVANYLGDPTAKYAGRLSLNPIKHIDMWGTIVIPLLLIVTNAGFVFGWAKPVPVNYYNLKYGKYGPLLVALAGPVTNFLVLVVCGLLYRISPENTALPFLFLMIGLVSAILMMFNLIPIPPLDGSKVLFLFLDKRPDIIARLEQYGMFVLLGVIILAPQVLNNFVFLPAFTLTAHIMGVPVADILHIL